MHLLRKAGVNTRWGMHLFLYTLLLCWLASSFWSPSSVLLWWSDLEQPEYRLWKERAAGVPLLRGSRLASRHVEGIFHKGQPSCYSWGAGWGGQSLIISICLALSFVLLFLFPIRTQDGKGAKRTEREKMHLKPWVPAISPPLCKYLLLLNRTHIILSGESYDQKLKHCASMCQLTVPLVSDMLTGKKEKAGATNRLWACCARPWTKSTYSLTAPRRNPWGDTIIIFILLMRKIRFREKSLVQGQEGVG